MERRFGGFSGEVQKDKSKKQGKWNGEGAVMTAARILTRKKIKTIKTKSCREKIAFDGIGGDTDQGRWAIVKTDVRGHREEAWSC